MVASRFRPGSFHPDRPGLVAPVRVDPAGLRGPTPGQARGPGWRRTTSGLFTPADVEQTVEQRIVEAASLISRGRGAVTGWAALRWLGGSWFDGSTATHAAGLPVDLAVSARVRPRDGVVVCRERSDPAEVIIVDSLPVTFPLRSVAYAMRYAPDVRSAAKVFAMAAYDDLVSRDEMRLYVGEAPRAGLSSWTGVPLAREALLHADENCWSPQEVLMELIWILDAGLPTPLMNRPVFDRLGRHIGTPDLLDPESGTICEYDGRLHLEGSRRAGDIRREEAFREVGLEALTLVAGDTADPDGTARRMVAARRRARWLPEGQRAWTTEPPDWWVPTLTVEQRRSLSAGRRARLLRHRRAA
ncbi:hypothetical protein [Nocardioides euryhalodurans]|uniref:AbiEi antitoxin C-terminal domain-containing protein n=1 Tax=Nocardioides euryhalodurans TaxID=2518370 RepID=A0A4P7GPZ4_9ACTN|nr:hypothetical protein [Nocardioides euryhalodurans]QBR94220.1 hypothetical protein EXE57_19445 [Nocardioides euryhalodurans]